MKLIRDFYDYLLPELPGCTTAFLDLHLVEVARKLCEDSLVWRAELDAVDLEADEDTYDIDSPEPQSVVCKVLRLTLDDDVLWDPEWFNGCGRDEPTYNLTPPFSVNEDFTQITLVEDHIPGAAVTDGLEIKGALKPKFGADRLPDILLTTHLEALRKSVLHRLMLMPKKPWSNPELAVVYGNEATRLIHRAATNTAGGNVRGPLRTRKANG